MPVSTSPMILSSSAMLLLMVAMSSVSSEYLRTCLRSRGYLTRRDLGTSRKVHRSSFLEKGDSIHLCRKSLKALSSACFLSRKD